MIEPKSESKNLPTNLSGHNGKSCARYALDVSSSVQCSEAAAGVAVNGSAAIARQTHKTMRLVSNFISGPFRILSGIPLSSVVNCNRRR